MVFAVLDVCIAAVKACISSEVCCCTAEVCGFAASATVESEGVVTLAEHGCIAAAGLQGDTTWRIVKRARLVCLRLWVLRSLRAAVLLQCNAASALGNQKSNFGS